ncbi:PTS sugar transporter subunit IIA [Vagococcus sp. JNUCC 83]
MIHSDCIFLDKNFKTKDEVIKFISKQAVAKEISNRERDLISSFIKREEEGSTGMMDGFAIPHAKSDSIIKPAVIIVKLDEGIEWDSMDGQPINFVIALLIPESESGTTHLKLLSNIARALMDEEFKKGLTEANSVEEIVSIFKNREI